MNRILFFILTYILVVGSGYSSPGNKARTFDMKDGLPSINISLVRQDDRGLIWIGTWNGLSFFNGERFYTFRSDDLKGRLSTNRIHSLLPDSVDNVWFLTYDRKLNLLDKDKGRLITISEILPEETKLPDFRDLYRSRDAMWAVSYDEKDLAKITYNDKSPHGYNIQILSASELMPGSTKFLGVISGGNGESWIVTDKKTFLEGSELAISGELTGIAEADGKSFLVTKEGNLFSLTGNQLKEETPLKDFGKITGVVRINNSYIGIASTNGYAVYNIKTRQW